MEANAREPGTGETKPTPAGPPAGPADAAAMTAPQALARAWFLWLGLIAVILVTGIVVLWIMVISQTGNVNASNDLAPLGTTVSGEGAAEAVRDGNADPGIHPSQNVPLLVGLGLLGLSMGGLFVRRRYFAAYYRGEAVRPDDYLKGMACVWVPIFVAVFVSEVMTVITGNYFPTPVAGIVGTILLFIFVPNGRSMTSTVGGSDDPGSYEEPK